MTMNQRQQKVLTSSSSSPPQHVFIRAGLPFLLFVAMSSYVLSSAIEGKNKEREISKSGGSEMTKSERQYKLEQEKEDMMKKLQKKLKEDKFDNTKRIERPEEILARRKKEREEEQRWYRRLGRWVWRS